MRLVTEYILTLAIWSSGHLVIWSALDRAQHQDVKYSQYQMTAVLLSGGLDSAVLLAEEAAARPVQPIYVSAGLAWEQAERIAVDAFLDALALPTVGSLAALTVDM